MANGRCRMHGGKSTGPRTQEGRERCRRAKWKHGAFSAAARAALADVSRSRTSADVHHLQELAESEIAAVRVAALAGLLSILEASDV
jgi:hypothetical protein